MVTIEDIADAQRRIAGAVYRSPCAHSQTFSRLTGLNVYFKLENLQMSGSFKERGALNKLLCLTPEERERGVIAASAGNHAQGVAYHATRLGLRSVIVMPRATPLIKAQNTRDYGGEVILHGENYDDAYSEAQRRADAEQLTYIHAFDDDAVIAGQGTIGLEILEQLPDVEAVVAPIGGGGLLAGIAVAIKAHRPQALIIGVQSARLASAREALAQGAPVTLPPAATLADGIAVRRTGERTFPLLRELVDEVVTVTEEEIANAILLLLEREKTVAEGAGAAATSAIINQKTSLPLGKKTAVLVCGGNIDVNIVSRIIERGLAKDGRQVKLEIRVADSPGGLHTCLGVLAERGANIVDIAHSRTFGGVSLGETLVHVTLETRGLDHIKEIMAALRRAGYEHRRHLV